MKEELGFQVKLMDMAEPSEEDVAASKEKLKTLNDRWEMPRGLKHVSLATCFLENHVCLPRVNQSPKTLKAEDAQW